ncbi:MAG: ribonuclease T2 family protein [Paracoccaceae bacterium]
MRGLILAALMAPAFVAPAMADGEAAGDFDYYVMALSWSANWCALEGDGRGDPQCDAGRGLTFTLHGLWPQYEDGWPAFCRTTARDPSRSQTAAMADIMGGAGLAFYEWKKHGRCSGLSADAYFALSRQAYDSVVIPEVFRDLNRDVALPASVVEEAFLEANPDLTRDQITITCTDGMIQEARVCLTKDLAPRRCGDDVIRDCRMQDAVMEAVR